MKLNLFFDHRFFRDADGEIRSLTHYNYELFSSRYLSVFDTVDIVARVSDGQPPTDLGPPTEGPGVRVVSLGDWRGPKGALQNAKSSRHIVQKQLNENCAAIMIAPGTVGYQAYKGLRRKLQPYGIEVVGDPQDVFSTGANKHPLRPIFQRTFTRRMNAQAGNAFAAAYVTSEALQKRYPPTHARFTTNYSSIELNDEHLAPVPRTYAKRSSPFRIVSVGSFAQMQKGPDILIDAISKCVQMGLDIEMTFVGEGQHRKEMEQLARRLGLPERVRFLGQLSAGAMVRQELDRADLFVLPSRQEGLPRAMIEAMARALPCIGSNVGGIPELLNADYVVPVGDSQILAARIAEVMNDRCRLETMSAANLKVAQEYRASILGARRRQMYSILANGTTEWLATR